MKQKHTRCANGGTLSPLVDVVNLRVTVGTPTEDCSSLTWKVMLLLWQKSSLFGVGKDMLNTSLIKNCGAGQVLTCTDVLTMYWKRGTTSLAKSLAVLQ